MLSFEPWVWKVQMDQIICEFTVICPKKKIKIKTKANQAVSNAPIDCWSCLILIPNLTILFQFEFNWIHICVIFGICNSHTFNYKSHTSYLWVVTLFLCNVTSVKVIIIFFVVVIFFKLVIYLLYTLREFQKLVMTS